ncbi:BA75_00404T0 [Komagataella pastoris]|uniref:BA75_00404T0 n=1 Tax=Komagataella pastoris TaxID=4922 RepID=A0A1B2J7J3_PICPA|nr:BA75_00404T0 [Komagataella pastoris]
MLGTRRFHVAARRLNVHAIHQQFTSPPDIQYRQSVVKARTDCTEMLNKFDKSSYLLAHYIPEPARDTWMAIRCFLLEVNKISDSNTRANSQFRANVGVGLLDVKFKFWEELLQKVFLGGYQKPLGEPVATLLRDGINKELNLDMNMFQQILTSRLHYLKNTSKLGFKNMDEVCSYGEGIYSQSNYLTQRLLLSPNISPSAVELLEQAPFLETNLTEVAAHLGQATGVATMLIGLKYYATTQNHIPLPLDLMAKHDLSQEQLLRLFNGYLEGTDLARASEQLSNVVFDVATCANDHILTARQKFDQLKQDIGQVLDVEQAHNEFLQSRAQNWTKKVPDVLYVPFMSSIPTQLYLSKLEKYNFDINNGNLQSKDWKLAWKSYSNYSRRSI